MPAHRSTYARGPTREEEDPVRKKKEKAPKPPKPPGGGKIRQLRDAYSMTRKADRLLPWMLLLAFVVDFALVFALGLLIGQLLFGLLFAILTAPLTVLIVFGNRVQKAAYAEVEGQVGAAAAVMNTMRRGGWTVTAGVAANKSQDIVHRAVGKPGIVLIGEGNPGRVDTLIEAERRRMNRFVADVPVTGLVVGDGEGEVPLRKLNRFLMKMPRKLKGRDVVEVNDRLRAVGDLMKNVPIPKGPMPKGVKLPKGPNPKAR